MTRLVWRCGILVVLVTVGMPNLCLGALPDDIGPLLQQSCLSCHEGPDARGGLDLTTLSQNLEEAAVRNRWIRIHDRVDQGEMPPERDDLSPADRARFVRSLGTAIDEVDRAEVRAAGRGPLRRLTRDEYEQNLRDVLRLPTLDIRDLLPPDRESLRFNKTAAALDLSREQLVAYLEAAEKSLRQAMASGIEPPPVTRYQALATRMFQEAETFGNREAMFYAKEGRGIPLDRQKLTEIRQSGQHDPAVEMAIFRSAHWPYYGYPDGFVAALPGEYRVRFSARSVLQRPGYELIPATHPVPMTFRARKPSGPDVSGDVRATGGLLDIVPEVRTYETMVRLLERETLEYSLLGLPVPLARNVDNGPPTYRYPPLPEGGQPGIAFQSLEIEGPISPADWPPPAHRVLFDDLPIQATPHPDRESVEVVSREPLVEASRLLRRFVDHAARQPVSAESLARYEVLIRQRLEQGATFAEAMLAGYQAFLCSTHFLYLPEPRAADDQFAIASRLSHFLTNSRPDARLMQLAGEGRLREAPVLREETLRLIASEPFERMVTGFTDYWLDLRHIRRHEPDVRLFPEYRFDDYLVESLERESRAFFGMLVRENLPARAVVAADFVLINDRLAAHYGLEPVAGSRLRAVTLPPESPYGGILTQGAVLKVTANGTATSPVIRGAWIMERLIGQPPPPPPASVPAVEPDIRGARSIRELLALHAKSEACATCHARFDGVGLALENFDVFGSWRTRYRGLEQGERVTGIDRAGHDFAYTLGESVDASGALADGRAFRDVRELKGLLAGNPRQLARNLLQQFTLYATGTPIRFSDRSEIERLLDQCVAADYRVRDLFLALVQSRIFVGEAGCHE